MTDDPVATVARALQAANANYGGNEFNLHAYWRHLASAALRAARAGGGEGDVLPSA